MHEMSYVVRFVNKAIETAKDEGADKVESICVSVGEMTDVIEEYLYRYYPQAVKGTILEGSKLEVKVIAVKALCNKCGCVYHPDKSNDYSCPACGSLDARITDGRTVVLDRVVCVIND